MAFLRSALIATWSALLFVPWFFEEPSGWHGGRIPPWARMSSSAVLVVLALLGLAAVRDADLKKLQRSVAVAMGFGLVGDLLLAGFLGLRGTGALGAGMLVFALGHGAYLHGMRAVAPFAPLPVAVASAVAATGWAVAVYGGGIAGPLLGGGSLVYAQVLATVVGAAAGLARKEPAFRWMAIGAASFLASDLLLSLELFRPALFRWIPLSVRGDVVWLLYGTGQLLLVTAAPHVQRRRASPASGLAGVG